MADIELLETNLWVQRDDIVMLLPTRSALNLLKTEQSVFGQGVLQVVPRVVKQNSHSFETQSRHWGRCR